MTDKENQTGTDGDKQPAEDYRTGTARAHDDKALTEGGEKTPSQQGRSGGNLQRDVGTQAAEERVEDPDAREGVTKEDEIAHGQR